MSPLLLIPVALVFVASGTPRRRRVTAKTADKPKHVRWVGETWEILPTFWDAKTKQLQDMVQTKESQGEDLYVCDLTLELLRGETAGFPLPASGSPQVEQVADQSTACGWQTTNPASTIDYYDGPPSVAFLQEHIAQYVADALARYEDRGELILIPAPESP